MDTPQTVPSGVNKPVAVWASIDDTNAKVSLSGKVDVYSLGVIWGQIRESQNTWLAQGNAKSKVLTFDASQVGSLDGAGMAFLIDVEQAQQKAGGTFTLLGLEARYQPLLKEFDPITNLFPTPAVKPQTSFIVSTGMATQNLLDDAKGLITFTGHLSADLFWSVMHPRQVRWGDFVNAAVQAGIAALPIVGLVSNL